MGFWRERTTDADDVGAAKHVLQTDELDAELGGELVIRIGIVSDQFHIEWLDHSKQFGPDIADSDGPERTADEADAHMFSAARKAGCAFAGTYGRRPRRPYARVRRNRQYRGRT